VRAGERRHPSLVSERTTRELERLAAERRPPDVLYESLLALLERDGLHHDGACWHVTDPVTGFFTRTGVVGEVPGDFQSALHFELFEEDVAKLDELGRRKVPVASLVHETEGEPERSLRYREMIRPDGHADELRTVFADPFGRWGSLAVFREHGPFTRRDRDALAHVVPLFAHALRIAGTIGDARAAAAPVPGVLVLDRDERLESADARARALLGEPDQEPLELPGAVYVAAARARHEGGAIRGRMRAGSGAWLLLDATELDRSRIAVVVQPAPAATLVDIRLRAAGLTEREREVAAAVLRGDSTPEIAAALFLSPWTVQDHLKSIFEKTGVRSRRELVQQVALGAAAASVEP
jgi:DNA-binding CsgD family transcriptional regulator